MCVSKDTIDEEKFVGVDFHVHTPASNCYKGTKCDDEYLNILRKYLSKNIRVIAITDHNTLKGYRKLCILKEELNNKYKVLNEYSERHSELKEELNRILLDIDLFKKILILPGVEFESNPGIHLLLIFDPKSDLDKVERFLENAGYDYEMQGLEKPETICKIDVLDVLNSASSLEAIVIAAHVDSDKGIYKLEGGLYRAQIFRSSQLTAISYNNPNNRDKIQEMLLNGFAT